MAGVENMVSPRAVALMSRTRRTLAGSSAARGRGGRRRTRRCKYRREQDSKNLCHIT